MRDNENHHTPLPERFVVSLVKVFQTTSVELFNEKIVQFHNTMEFQRFGDDDNDTYNNVQAGLVFYESELFGAKPILKGNTPEHNCHQ